MTVSREFTPSFKKAHTDENQKLKDSVQHIPDCVELPRGIHFLLEENTSQGNSLLNLPQHHKPSY